jgi:hypothetical protein
MVAVRARIRDNVRPMRSRPIDPERNRRLYGEVLSWLFLPARRPGMLGPAASFTGTAPRGKAKLRKKENGNWDFSVEGGGTQSIDAVSVLTLIGSGQFHPHKVRVLPDLAEPLFMQAVHEAEMSAVKIDEAGRHLNSVLTSEEASQVGSWVVAAAALDRGLRAGIVSVILAIASGEAQVNCWAELSGGWLDDEDHWNLVNKCEGLAKRAGQPIEKGKDPYQQLQEAVMRRNSLLHSRPVEEPFPVTGSKKALPGRWMLLEARRSCFAVRTSLVDLARRLKVATPEFLAYCPHGDPTDDEAWRSATVLTGVRPDPDFPSIGRRESGGAVPQP